MKGLLLLCILFSLQLSITSQTAKSKELPEWFRLYTYDESYVEIDRNYVMFSNKKLERVRLRWTYLTPQSLVGKPDVKFISILQEVQFDCRNAEYRIYSVQWLDSEAKEVNREDKKETEDLIPIKSGKMISKIYSSACQLIELRKRDPPLEPQ